MDVNLGYVFPMEYTVPKNVMSMNVKIWQHTNSSLFTVLNFNIWDHLSSQDS